MKHVSITDVRAREVILHYLVQHTAQINETLIEVLSIGKKKHLVQARQAVMFDSYELGCTQEQIAGVLGMDASTVSDGIRDEGARRTRMFAIESPVFRSVRA